MYFEHSLHVMRFLSTAASNSAVKGSIPQQHKLIIIYLDVSVCRFAIMLFLFVTVNMLQLLH